MNTQKILIAAGIAILSLTSCGANLDLYESRTPTILPNDIGESTPEDDSYETSTSELEVVSDAIPSAYNNIEVSETDQDNYEEENDSNGNETYEEYDEVSEETVVENTCSDTIYMLDGRVFPITFVSESSFEVKYKKCDDPLNRTFRKDKSKILQIVYSNGEVKEYNSIEQRNINQRNQEESAKRVGAGVGVAFAALAVGTVVVGGGLILWILSNF